MNALHWLAATTLVTGTLWLPYVLDRIVVIGLWSALDNPRDDVQLHPWAERARAAHANAVENLVLFAAAVLAAAGLGLAEDGTVILACQVYLASRLLHTGVYIAGIPVLRTLTFALGWLSVCVIGMSALTA